MFQMETSVSQHSLFCECIAFIPVTPLICSSTLDRWTMIWKSLEILIKKSASMTNGF